MKIHEIVTENSDLDEGRFKAAWDAFKAGGQAAADIAPELKGMGPKWAQWVNRQANKVSDYKSTKWSAAHNTARAAFTVSSAAMSVLKTWQLLDPLLVYQSHMAKWEKELQAGKITEDQYEAIREKELTQLVGQWATILATNGMLRVGIFPILGIFKVLGLNTIHAFVNTMTKGAQAALMMWWNSSEGRSWIASTLALGTIGDVDYVSSIVGGNIAQLLDKLKGKVRKAPNGATAQEPNADAGQGTQPAAGQEPATAPASNQKTNPQDYEYYSSTLVKNKKTGEIELKDF